MNKTTNSQENTKIRIIKIRAKANIDANERERRSSKSENIFISLPVIEISSSFPEPALSSKNFSNYLIFWKEKFTNLPDYQDPDAFWTRKIKGIKKGQLIEAEVSVKTIEGNDGKKLNMITVWNLISVESDPDSDYQDPDSDYDADPISWFK